MKVYWGGVATGKNFLKQHCLHNNLSIVGLYEYFCHGKTSIIHHSYLDKRLYHLDSRMWCDWTDTHTTYYKRNNIPKQISHSVRQCEYMKMMNLAMGEKIVWNKTNYLMDDAFDNNHDRKIKFKDPIDVSTVLQSGCDDSLIMSMAVKKYKNILQDNLIDEVLPKDIPKCDVLMPQRYIKHNKAIRTTKYIPPEFNEYDVIVPYKSNIKDHVESCLDNIGGFASKDVDIVKQYSKDKKWLWNYLDEHCLYLHIRGVEQTLRSNNIKYRYFDLDNDNYLEFFGGKMVKDRLSTNPIIFLMNMANDKDLARKKYDILQEMSDEYIRSRNLTDVRLP